MKAEVVSLASEIYFMVSGNPKYADVIMHVDNLIQTLSAGFNIPASSSQT